jgi:hypothetical protein
VNNVERNHDNKIQLTLHFGLLLQNRLSQIIYGGKGFKIVKMKGNTSAQGEIITEQLKHWFAE